MLLIVRDSEVLIEEQIIADSSVLSLNRALDEDASIIANFQSIDITTTLPPKLRQRAEYLHAEREFEDYE